MGDAACITKGTVSVHVRLETNFTSIVEVFMLFLCVFINRSAPVMSGMGA
jgi:hypothetical protein